jgi:hypothetical protein
MQLAALKVCVKIQGLVYPMDGSLVSAGRTQAVPSPCRWFEIGKKKQNKSKRDELQAPRYWQRSRTWR